MAVKSLLVRILVLAGASGACGGEDAALVTAGDERAPNGAANSGVSPLLPGAAEEGSSASDGAASAEGQGEGEGTPGEPASCEPAECPEVLLFGVLTPGCCRFGNLCGGRVQVSERTWACLAPEVNEQGEELRSALTRAARQPFEADPSCPSHTIDGDELSGCCRSGLCGVDTQPWSSAAAAFGLALPRACLDPREAAELASQPPISASSRSCGR